MGAQLVEVEKKLLTYEDMNTNQKGFVNGLIIVLAVAVAGTIGYFAFVKRQVLPTEIPTPTPTPQNVTQNNVDDCSLIRNSSFRSINQYERGLRSNGTAEMGYWTITLLNGTFQWGHSDFGESGTYTCANDTLQVKFFDRSMTAHYDWTKKILTWDDIEYKKNE